MQVHIWDFSGQTTQFLNDRINLPNGSMGQSAEEVTGFLLCYYHFFFSTISHFFPIFWHFVS